MVVMKFGGTSVADAEAMRQTANIVQRELERRPAAVILSACGGATNELLAMVELAGNGNFIASKERADRLEERHLRIAEELIADDSLARETYDAIRELCAELRVFCEGASLLGECTPRSKAFAAATGELLSTAIFERHLRSQGIAAILVDARKFMRTDDSFLKAVVDKEELERLSAEHIQAPLSQGLCVISQGFIGADSSGRTTTLGRGGSDYSAALIGAALSAEEIQIWTDVSGIAATDPRKMPETRFIRRMTFAEARELAFYGAKILHPETILPAVESGIAVRVLNTFMPDAEGTTIEPAALEKEYGFRAATLKEGVAAAKLPQQSSCASAADLASIIRNSGWTVYFLAMGDAAPILASDCPKEQLLDVCSDAGIQASVQLLDLLCIVGPDVLNRDPVQIDNSAALMSEIHRAGAVFSMIGHSNASVLALFPEGLGSKALGIIHNNALTP